MYCCQLFFETYNLVLDVPDTNKRNVVRSIVDHGSNGAGQGVFRGNKRTHEGVDVVVAECSSLGTARF